MTLVLHSMWRASAPYRVRIGLNLKGVAYDYAPVNFAKGEQRQEPYLSVNRQGLAPALNIDGEVLTQSLAILEWLDETHPEPPLLPRDPMGRARVRAMADIVACDIHPVNNLRIRNALADLGHPHGGADQLEWQTRWMADGFAALEQMVARHSGGFCFGETPTIADCCLIPQIANAHLIHLDMTAYPALAAVADRAADHPAFIAALPERQPDAPAL